MAGAGAVILIALAGEAGSGKTTAARLLARHFGFTRASFADALKRSAAAALGVPVSLLEDSKRDQHYRVALLHDGDVIRELTVREFLQHYGSEAHREVFGPDFWTLALEAQLDLDGGRIVVDDLRTPNEARWVASLGGQVYRVTNPRVCPSNGLLHETELPLPDSLLDGEIRNNGSADDLLQQLERSLFAEMAEANA
jgi:hypothetical protein